MATAPGGHGVPDILPLLARVPDHREFFGFDELRARATALCAEFPGIARMEQVGASTEGRPIEMLSVGHGRTPVLLLGVPHPNEPIGTLTIDFLTRLLCEDDALRTRLDVTLHAIPVADPDGLVLNEGWFKGAFSPLRYALHFYRPPHREQVEWSFPVLYKTLRWTTPTAETATVMRVMERVRPRVYYSLHNAGFCGVYFYVSDGRPDLYPAYHALVASQGLPLHRGEPEVPYLRTLAPAIYGLFGIDETYEYLARTLDEDPATVIEAGTCGDDWIRRVCDAYSLVCELPYYTAPALDDASPAGCTRREAVRAGIERGLALHAELEGFVAALGERAPDHRLTRSVVDYVRKLPKRLAAQRAEAETVAYAREATRAEAIDATVCSTFYHLLYFGELHRLAVMVGDAALADAVHARLSALAAEVERDSALRVLPIRPLVAVQAGAGLLAMGAAGSGV
ncbi:MAG: peptidase M14 [bacterium]|nr:peptidase M14 [bacterium]